MNKPSVENKRLPAAGKTIASTDDDDRKTPVKGLISKAMQDDVALSSLSSSPSYACFRLVL